AAGVFLRHVATPRNRTGVRGAKSTPPSRPLVAILGVALADSTWSSATSPVPPHLWPEAYRPQYLRTRPHVLLACREGRAQPCLLTGRENGSRAWPGRDWGWPRGGVNPPHPHPATPPCTGPAWPPGTASPPPKGRGSTTGAGAGP